MHFGPGPMFAGGPGPMICGMAPLPPDLNLTDDQLEAMHKQRNEFMAKSEPLHAELKVAESAYFDALTQPTVDKAQVKQ
ncbi:hypothetical protein ABTK13_20950, partial [Acinetobacter baumannii]